jgi:hypothetical protein
MDVYGIVDLYRQSFQYKSLQENKELALYTTVALLFPFLFDQSQILLGSAVNTTLVLSAFYLKGRKVLPLIVLPSVSAVARGMIFGPMTINLIYMMPFIWVGNALLIGAMKLLRIKMRMNYAVSSAVAISSKVGFLFISSYALFTLGVVPEIFLYAMGIMQAATAVAGCTSAYFVDLGRKKFLEK